MSVPTPAKRDAEGLTRAQRLDMMLEIFQTIATPGKEYTRRQIAAAIGISPERVRQIEEGALDKLRRETARRRTSYCPTNQALPQGGK